MTGKKQESLYLDFLGRRGELLLSWLDANATGAKNARRRAEAARATGVSVREISQTVKDLIEIHGVMISTTSRGIFVPETFEEYSAGYRNTVSRLKSLAARAKKQRKLIEDRFDSELYEPLFYEIVEEEEWK